MTLPQIRKEILPTGDLCYVSGQRDSKVSYCIIKQILGVVSVFQLIFIKTWTKEHDEIEITNTKKNGSRLELRNYNTTIKEI